MKQRLIKLFFKLVSNRFLIQEITDHERMLEQHLLMNWDEEIEVRHYLDTYLLPEMKRRGL